MVLDANVKDFDRHVAFKKSVKKDPNWVSEEERDALESLKKHPVCDQPIFKQNEKILYAFLFARKLNVNRTVKLMEKYLVRFF